MEIEFGSRGGGQKVGGGDIRFQTNGARLKAQEKMSHGGIASNGQSSDVAGFDTVLFQKSVNKGINRVDDRVMNGRQSAPTTGKDHPRDNILTILGLLIVTCLHSQDSTTAQIHQLSDNGSSAYITGN